MCRKDLTAKPKAATPKPTPYTPLVRTVPESTGRIITYQEFVDTIHQNTVIQVAPSAPPVQQTVQKPQQLLTAEKFCKLLVLFGVLVAVIVLIFIFT